MAEIAVVPAVGAPPVVGTLALQLPYVADQQGTLTKWLVDNTAGASPDEILVILAATNTKYAEAAAKIADGQADAASSLVKELAEDILAAEPLEVFLTVTTPEGGKSMVVTVARLARYRAELGQVSAWAGQVFGFL